MEKVYQFIYNYSCCESAAYTISIHKTRKGAEMAMEFHKNETKVNWLKDKIKNLNEFNDEYPWDFDQYWGIKETELLD